MKIQDGLEEFRVHLRVESNSKHMVLSTEQGPNQHLEASITSRQMHEGRGHFPSAKTGTPSIRITAP